MKQYDSSRVDDLAAKLATCKVADMASGLSMDPQVNAIWNEFADVGLYMPLLEDAHRPAAVRFAAALVLRSKHAEQLRKANPQIVAQVFATALQLDLAGLAEPWGHLWGSDDPLGLLGQVFIELGRPAQQSLEALLDDSTVRDSYTGSEQATEMAMRRYRVKDFAAFYLARILGLALPWESNLARRDDAIAKLRTQIPHGA